MSRTVTITGGNGYVGQLVRRGLADEGYQVRVFDQFRGALVDLLRRRRLVNATAPAGRRAARAIRAGQRSAEAWLRRAHVIRPGADNILSDRDFLVARFAGSHAVIHLAAIPYPRVPGATREDYLRLNYDGAVNVFEAARAAGVATFVFASSAQVYAINSPVRLDQFPVLESNYLPHPAEGQTTYGFLKAEFERYLDRACASGTTQAIALRLENPGFQSTEPSNLYVSTTVENLLAGFSCALSAGDELGFEAFNIADNEVDAGVVDIQSYLSRCWPGVPNHTVGNQCLLGVDKARRLIGYQPARYGRYLDTALVW